MSQSRYRAVSAYLDAVRRLQAADRPGFIGLDPLIDALHRASADLYPLLEDSAPADLLDRMRAVDDGFDASAIGTISFSGLQTHGPGIVRELDQLRRQCEPAPAPPAPTLPIHPMPTPLLLSDDPHVRAYLEELTRRGDRAIAVHERAARATPGSTRTESSNGDGTKRVRVSIPLTTDEAFDALTAGMTFHAHNRRDIGHNQRLIDDGLFPPPGWDPVRWRALALAVGADPADADDEKGRERITQAALAAVNRQRLQGFGRHTASPVTPHRRRTPGAHSTPIEAVAAELRRLHGLGISKPTDIVAYMQKPDGANLRAAVNAALKAKPRQKRTGKPATNWTIIEAAKQRNRRPEATS